MNEKIEAILPQLSRIQQRALIAGVIGVAGLAVGAFTQGDQFFQSYLFGYMFWIGLALGSFGIFMLHNLVGGPWGFTIRRLLESGIRTIPVMLVLFLPLAFGIHHLYEWSHADVVAKDPVLQHKSVYLNETFFLVRMVIYFVVWFGMSTLLTRMVRKQEELGGAHVTPRIQNLSGLGVVIFALTATFAVFDWVMSLEPHWGSTIYGLIFVIGQALSTFAFSIIMVVAIMGMSPKYAEKLKSVYFHDLGNFMFAFTMLWAYVGISQLLIIWAANLPEETPWYASRLYTSWGVIPAVLFAVHFFLPFLLLLSRKIKRNPKALARVAMLIILMRFVDLFWLISPAFNRDGLHFHWLDLAAPIGIGGIWVYVYIFFLKKGTTLLPANTPFLAHQAEHH